MGSRWADSLLGMKSFSNLVFGGVGTRQRVLNMVLIIHVSWVRAGGQATPPRHESLRRTRLHFAE